MCGVLQAGTLKLTVCLLKLNIQACRLSVTVTLGHHHQHRQMTKSHFQASLYPPFVLGLFLVGAAEARGYSASRTPACLLLQKKRLLLFLFQTCAMALDGCARLKSTGAFKLWNIGNHSDNVVPKGAVILSTPTDCGGEIHKVGLQCRNTAKPCSTEFCVLVGEVQRPQGSKMKNDNYENCGKLLNGTFTPGSEIIPPHTQDVQCQAVHQ